MTAARPRRHLGGPPDAAPTSAERALWRGWHPVARRVVPPERYRAEAAHLAKALRAWPALAAHRAERGVPCPDPAPFVERAQRYAAAYHEAAGWVRDPEVAVAAWELEELADRLERLGLG